mgnify:CR=1 FL=1
MIKEKDGRFTCADCGHVYSSMLGDDEIPETCNECIDILIDGLKLEIDSCEEFIRCWDYKGNENNEDVVNEKKRLKKAKKLLDILCSNDYYISILNSQRR